ncbi:MAG: hypothetical protein WCF68_04890 [Terriglobales bacterium]
MRPFSAAFGVFLFFYFIFSGLTASPVSAQTGSTISLHATSTMNVPSENGGAFMNGSKCDADGNLYIRKYMIDRPLLGPVVKIDAEGKRVAVFDPVQFPELAMDRADGYSPASDGGMYQIARGGGAKPLIYVLRFSSDGTPSSPVRLDADFEVYTFAAFAGGNFLVSGVKRDTSKKDDRGRNFTAVFSADGRELAQLSFEDAHEIPKAGAKKEPISEAGKAEPTLDLAEAEAGVDGYLYVMRRSSPAMVYAIAPKGKIMQTIKVNGSGAGMVPGGFHVSGNRLAVSFWSEDGERHTVVVADAQTGRKIASYGDAGGLGPSFACYSANEGVFTFLRLGEGNALDVIRAEVR